MISNLSGDLSREKAVKPSSRDGVIKAVEERQDHAVDVAGKWRGTSLDDRPEAPEEKDALRRTVTAQDCTYLSESLSTLWYPKFEWRDNVRE